MLIFIFVYFKDTNFLISSKGWFNSSIERVLGSTSLRTSIVSSDILMPDIHINPDAEWEYWSVIHKINMNGIWNDGRV